MDGEHSANGAAGEPTVARALQALKAAQELLNAACSGYFGALAGEPAEGWAAPVAELVKPLTISLERAYGGLADAFGLAPWRELDAALRELGQALLAQQRAQAAYLELALGATREGVEALIARLAEMGERGESVDTMLALMRLCAGTMDGAMHRAMQSPHALEVSAEAIRTGLRSRQQQQRLITLASRALNLPTRADVDEAYREIQELKREVRRLRKAGTGNAQVNREVLQ